MPRKRQWGDIPMNHARIVRADGTGPRPWGAAAPVPHLLPALRAEGDAAAACPATGRPRWRGGSSRFLSHHAGSPT